MAQATLSAGLSRIGFMRARVIAAPAHLGALIAAKPRILDMIPDAARGRAFSSWRRVSLRSSRPPPPPVSALSTTVSRYELLSLRMQAATMGHHSWQRAHRVDQGVQVGAPWVHDFEMSEPSDDSAVIEYEAPEPAVSYTGCCIELVLFFE